MTSNIPISYSSSSNGTAAQEVQQQGLSRLILSHHYGSNSKPSSALANTSITSSSTQDHQLSHQAKKKRNLPGNPDPTAEVIALSPQSLMATNRFVCEICNKGFQRDQNLQLHRRGHNLPWKLKQRVNTEVRKKVYICPEPSCVHHNPSRALGDLTGIKKHYSRKHGEKKWKCDRCSKKYAVRSDLKAHSKNCGTREYKCDCGTIFSRRDSFITHRAFCDALHEENNKANTAFMANIGANLQGPFSQLISSVQMNSNNIAPLSGVSEFSNERIQLSVSQELMHMHPKSLNMARNMFSKGLVSSSSGLQLKVENDCSSQLAGYQEDGRLAHMSATAMLQEASSQMGAAASMSNIINSQMTQNNNMDQQATFGGIQLQQNNSFDHAQFMGVSTTNNQQLMQKGAREISSQLFANDHLGMFSRNFNSQNDHAILRNFDNEVNNGSSNLHGIRQFHSGTANSGNATKYGNDGNGNTTTVDFLGLGGMTRRDIQQLQKQEMEFENIWSG